MPAPAIDFQAVNAFLSHPSGFYKSYHLHARDIVAKRDRGDLLSKTKQAFSSKFIRSLFDDLRSRVALFADRVAMMCDQRISPAKPLRTVIRKCVVMFHLIPSVIYQISRLCPLC